MKLASRDWEEGNFDRIRKNLRVHFPQPEEEDLRGFEWYLLWNLGYLDEFTLDHGGGSAQPAFLPDGKLVSEGSGSVKLWDVKSGQFLRTLIEYHQGGLMGFHDDGKLMLLFEETGDPNEWWSSKRCASNGTLKFVEVATGKQVRSLEVRDLCSSAPDFETLVTSPDRETIKLVDAGTQEELLTLRIPREFVVSGGVFSPDGKMLALANFFSHLPLADGRFLEVILWDVETGKRILELGERKFERDNVSYLVPIPRTLNS